MILWGVDMKYFIPEMEVDTYFVSAKPFDSTVSLCGFFKCSSFSAKSHGTCQGCIFNGPDVFNEFKRNFEDLLNK